MRWLVVIAVLGCGGPAEPPAADPPRRGEPIPRPVRELIDEIASGAFPPTRVLDGSRGVVFAEYFEDASEQDPRAGADGLVKSAARLCGDELTARLRQFRRQLASHAAEVTCRDRTCSYEAGGEFDLGATIQFSGDVLVSVVLIEGGPVTAEFSREAQTWASAELARLADGRCP